MQALLGINLNRLVVFVAVVESGSLSAAARQLGLAKTMVSAHLQRLESELGASLLLRTTRRQSLTDAGQGFYEASRRIVRDAHDAVEAAGQDSSQPRGTLRITAPINHAGSMVAPVAVALRERYPDLRIELLASDRVVDLLAENIDVAIRAGRLADSSLQATRVGSFREWLVASPRLFEGGALPKSPRQVANRPFVALTALAQPLVWTFTGPGGRRRETARFESALSANTTDAVKAAAMAGGGLAVLPDYAAQAAVGTGQLIRLLPQWSLPERGIYAVFAAARHRPQKIRAFVEALKLHLQQQAAQRP